MRAFTSANQDWVNTRNIYNQHAYSITNILDDGSIPARARLNWKTPGLNNFRLNSQPGARYLPNLSIQTVTSTKKCHPQIDIDFMIINNGWAAAPTDVPIEISVSSTENGNYELFQTILTTAPMPVGGTLLLNTTYGLGENEALPVYLKFSFGATAPRMCRSDDKIKIYEMNCQD